jgi:hypothetical protein
MWLILRITFLNYSELVVLQVVAMNAAAWCDRASVGFDLRYNCNLPPIWSPPGSFPIVCRLTPHSAVLLAVCTTYTTPDDISPAQWTFFFLIKLLYAQLLSIFFFIGRHAGSLERRPDSRRRRGVKENSWHQTWSCKRSTQLPSFFYKESRLGHVDRSIRAMLSFSWWRSDAAWVLFSGLVPFIFWAGMRARIIGRWNILCHGNARKNMFQGAWLNHRKLQIVLGAPELCEGGPRRIWELPSCCRV